MVPAMSSPSRPRYYRHHVAATGGRAITCNTRRPRARVPQHAADAADRCCSAAGTDPSRRSSRCSTRPVNGEPSARPAPWRWWVAAACAKNSRTSNPPRSFGYTLSDIKGPLAPLVGRLEGEWIFEPVGTGTRVTWRWTIHPRSALAAPVLPVFGRLWRGYARQSLEELSNQLAAAVIDNPSTCGPANLAKSRSWRTFGRHASADRDGGRRAIPTANSTTSINSSQITGAASNGWPGVRWACVNGWRLTSQCGSPAIDPSRYSAMKPTSTPHATGVNRGTRPNSATVIAAEHPDGGQLQRRDRQHGGQFPADVAAGDPVGQPCHHTRAQNRHRRSCDGEDDMTCGPTDPADRTGQHGFAAQRVLLLVQPQGRRDRHRGGRDRQEAE